MKICPAAGYRQAAMASRCDQLAVLKALGDETRYAMYRELARSTAALSAQDLAERSGIHANTVRLHLERLREAGLVDVEAGAPRHRRAAPAPLLPRGRRARARFRPARARAARRPARRAGGAGRRRRGSTPPRPDGCGAPTPAGAPGRGAASRALEGELARLGFEPATEAADGAHEGSTRIEFLHCPFRELAEAYPELVCNLHRGLCEGVVDSVGGGSGGGVRDVVRPRAVPRRGGVGYPDQDQ